MEGMFCWVVIFIDTYLLSSFALLLLVLHTSNREGTAGVLWQIIGLIVFPTWNMKYFMFPSWNVNIEASQLHLGFECSPLLSSLI